MVTNSSIVIVRLVHPISPTLNVVYRVCMVILVVSILEDNNLFQHYFELNIHWRKRHIPPIFIQIASMGASH